MVDQSIAYDDSAEWGAVKEADGAVFVVVVVVVPDVVVELINNPNVEAVIGLRSKLQSREYKF